MIETLERIVETVALLKRVCLTIEGSTVAFLAAFILSPLAGAFAFAQAFLVGQGLLGGLLGLIFSLPSTLAVLVLLRAVRATQPNRREKAGLSIGFFIFSNALNLAGGFPLTGNLLGEKWIPTVFLGLLAGGLPLLLVLYRLGWRGSWPLRFRKEGREK